MKKLLITGCHRSLTTILASVISRHKDISVLVDDYYDSYKRILSKKVVGVKMPIPSILWNKKRSMLYIFLFRKFYFIQKIFSYRHYRGRCNYCITDFLNDKIIFISRDKYENINSILRHTKQTRDQAEKDVMLAEKIRDKLMQYNNVYFTTAYEFTARKEATCKEICEFLGVEYDPNMLLGYQNNPVYKNDRILIKH